MVISVNYCLMTSCRSKDCSNELQSLAICLYNIFTYFRNLYKILNIIYFNLFSTFFFYTILYTRCFAVNFSIQSTGYVISRQDQSKKRNRCYPEIQTAEPDTAPMVFWFGPTERNKHFGMSLLLTLYSPLLDPNTIILPLIYSTCF